MMSSMLQSLQYIMTVQEEEDILYYTHMGNLILYRILACCLVVFAAYSY